MMKKFKGFTLGEILIAMSVVGVVATLVLPQLVNGQKAAQGRAQFDTAYSLIAKAIADMDADNVSILPASYSAAGNFYTKLKEYFIVTIDCGKYGTTNTDVCFSTINRDENSTYKRIDGSEMTDGELQLYDDGAFVLNNGMLIMLENPANNPNGLLISVDTNGKNKLPNRLGYDIFTFELTKNGLLPYGADGTTKKLFGDNPENFCNKNGNGQYNGITCAYYATTNKDYFVDVYSGH